MDPALQHQQNIWGGLDELHAKMDQILYFVRPQGNNDNHSGRPESSGCDESLREQLRHANENVHEYAQQLTEAEAKLSKLQAELKTLQEKESWFRSIILNKSGSQKMSDADVTDAFVNLRQMVQGVLKREYFGNLTLNRSKPLGHREDGRARDFWQPIDAYKGRKDRLLYARMKVFHLLNEGIFQVNTFGIVGVPLKGKRKANISQQVEEYLRYVENFMNDEDVPAAEISDWRAETFKCLSHLSPAREKPVRDLVMILLNYLRPLILPAVSRDKEDALEGDLTRLCEAAWEFRMMIRKAKEEYSIWQPEDACNNSRPRLSDLSRYAECMDVEGAKGGSEGDEIAFTLFGGLMKHPEYRGDVVCVLEKAHVVVRCK